MWLKPPGPEELSEASGLPSDTQAVSECGSGTRGEGYRSALRKPQPSKAEGSVGRVSRRKLAVRRERSRLHQ